MQTGDQSDVMAFLGTAEAYRDFGLRGPVKRVDTHASAVFLIGDRAFKLKRSVKFSYLDFSTPEARRNAAKAEVALNRRTAPSLYLGLVPVIRDAGGRLALGTLGDSKAEAVEWLVTMVRFDQANLLDTMAADGRLTVEVIAAAAESIARFHDATGPAGKRWGGAGGMGKTLKGVGLDIAESGPGILDTDRTIDLCARLGETLRKRGARLDARKADGKVKRCHGDLHLRNICLVDGRPTPFDCIEFSAAIGTIDVLYDLAFLLMDLWHRELHTLANACLNKYLELTGDYGGIDLMPFFMAMRAAIRAHIAATMAHGATTSRGKSALGDEARAYLDLACDLIAPPQPIMVAVGGLQGTGKTTVARGLAPFVRPAPGAVVLRTDVIRKRLLGKDPLERLGPEGYTPEMHERTYAALEARARQVLSDGHSVICDGMNARADERAALAGIAKSAGVRFQGVWLDAPTGLLEDRIAHRRDDASDATVATLRRSLDHDTGPIDWARVDAGGDRDEVLAAARMVTGL